MQLSGRYLSTKPEAPGFYPWYYQGVRKMCWKDLLSHFADGTNEAQSYYTATYCQDWRRPGRWTRHRECRVPPHSQHWLSDSSLHVPTSGLLK